MTQTSHPKIILLTGTSSGFGLLTAARLAGGGHRVFATMRDLSKKEALFAEVRKRGGPPATGSTDWRAGKVNVLPLDVTDKKSIQSTVDFIAAEVGYLDVLVNNAGYGIGGFFEDLTEEEIRQQMETNFFGVQNVTRAVIPLMRPRRQGKIINISSMAGIHATPALGAYNASKWALEGFSESLHYELKLFGIDVLLVEPGTYPTAIFQDNARYAQNFSNPQSPYYAASYFLSKRLKDYVDRCRKDPEAVALLVETLIEKKNPPFRNIPDQEGRMLYCLRRILPFRAYRWMVRKALFDSFERQASRPS